MFTDRGVLVNPVCEQGRLELVFLEAVLDEHPVVSNRTDQHRHHHWILPHLVDVVVFEQIEREIVRSFHKLNCSFRIKCLGGFGRGLLHTNAEVEKLHRNIGVVHELLLGLFKHGGGDAEFVKHNGG